MRHHKAGTMAFSTFSPGPDGTTVEGPQVPTYMTARIASPWSRAVGTQILSPRQEQIRTNASGRWPADSAIGAHAPVYALRQDPASGCCDVVGLEPVTNPGGIDFYADLGGKGGVDYGARRP